MKSKIKSLKTMQLVPAMEQGGVERGVVEVNRIIVNAGWENIIVSAGGRLLEKIVADGGQSIILDVKSKNPFTFFLRAHKLRKILCEIKPDVVCAHSRVPAWLFKFASRGLDIPWISFAHGANSVSSYSKIMTAGDLIVTPSAYLADYLTKAYGAECMKKMRVIPRAIDKERFDIENLDLGYISKCREKWNTDGKYVVMALGRITQLKGFDILIKAIARMKASAACKNQNFNTLLVIVGEAEARRKNVEADLKSLAADLGLSQDVIFAGNTKNVAECLSIADVVVSSNVVKPEAFGRSMAEALAMDKPVVARAFGGALDVVRNGVDGILIDADNSADWPKLFAEAIEKIRTIDFKDLRKNALERFSFEKMATSSLDAYREVAQLKENKND
jgi:glycosyltransferase involved in cell wall biosynthesis